jgi:outer membrane receptor for ferrienterochelin and colicin
MEFSNSSLIVNAGLRFDYFSPDYRIPVDWTQATFLRIPEYDDDGNPTGDSLLNRTDGPTRWQLSPRIGIAFPISSTGVIRFSAGLFFQIPQFSILYTNPNYEVNPATSNTNFGNPALDPERTLHFEIGLQQGITDALGLELTLFSKDIRNLTGVEIRRDVLTTNYFVRYINRDVGTSRGMTLSLFQRPIGPLSWDIDYTLQFAKGTSSNPTEAFDRFQSGQEDVLTLVRLDWDRRHVLTNSVTLSPNRSFSVTLINRLQSGAPYTTVRNFVTSYIENNADRPFSFTSDLRLFYRPKFFQGVSVTMQVDNVFDAKVHYGVYSDTGRGDESVTLEQFRRSESQVGGINSLDEYFFNQGWFSAPRRITVGVSYQF